MVHIELYNKGKVEGKMRLLNIINKGNMRKKKAQRCSQLNQSLHIFHRYITTKFKHQSGKTSYSK